MYFNALLYKNQFKAFRDNITLEDRKNTVCILYKYQSKIVKAFLYFIEINFKLKICNSGTRLHSKIGKVHFTTYIFYKNQYKMLRNNEKYIIFYKNQFKSFRYNITLEDRKSTLQLIYFIKINLKQRKTLYTLQKST